MKAVCWHGKQRRPRRDVPDPKILNPRDAIVKVTSTAICGSDLHLYDGFIPTMQAGDILGHEFMGEVVEVGQDVTNLKKGDRVVVPFTIACGQLLLLPAASCGRCATTPTPTPGWPRSSTATPARACSATRTCYGGYAGGQAEYVRVPFADVGPLKVPDGLPDEQVLFLSDIFPTGYMAAENCDIQPGDTVAVWGCGPVGQFAIQSACLLGAEPGHRHRPRRRSGWRWPASTARPRRSTSTKDDVYDRLDGDDRRPRARRAASTPSAWRRTAPALDAIYDQVKTALCLATDRPHVAAPGDHGLPQGRHGLDPRRLRRLPRQAPVRRRLRQGADVQDGPDARAPLPAAAARAHRRTARSTRRSSSPTGCRWTTRPRPTRRSATSRTGASRSCSSRK